MPQLKIHSFLGRKPATDDAMLEDNAATVATNCRIQGGKLKPLYEALQVRAKTVAGTLKTIYYYRPGSLWLEWTTDVDATPAQVGADAYDRVIYTGDGAPKMTYNSIITAGGTPYPGSSFLLGVPPPGYTAVTDVDGDAPTVATAGSPDDVNDIVDTRYYVVTCVDSVGAEGMPSPPSDQLEHQPGQTVNVGIPAIPAGNYTIASYRVYRTSSGSSSTEFQYVGGGTNWGGTFSDDVLSENLGEVLPTELYDLPNADLTGVMPMAGGYLAAFHDNVLCFSPPGAPHAWPVAYQINTKTDIVGIKPLDDNSLLVTTEDRPYVASGTDPSSMTLTELPILQSCTSKRSMADVGIGVVYASPDGLVLVSTTQGTKIITAEIFTREQWQALNPTTIEGFMWEGLYICFHSTGGFVINPSDPSTGIVDLTDTYAGAFHDPLADALYVTEGSNIKQWDASSTYMQFTWKSKVFEMLHPSGGGVAQFVGDSDDKFSLNVYTDGDLRETAVAKEGAPFRLSGGYRARKLQYEIVSRTDTTGGSLHGMRIGTSMKDLR